MTEGAGPRAIRTVDLPVLPMPGGAIPRTPAGTRVYAIGDVHGRADLLDGLHHWIAEDVAVARPERAVLVHLGDYVDRGPDSGGVIDRISRAPAPGIEVANLRGNHEALMLAFLDSGDGHDLWLMNGGAATLAGYHVRDHADTEALRREAQAAMPPRHLAVLRGLRAHHREADYVFVHAGIRPGVALEDQAPEDMMWIRDRFLRDERDHGAVVVHGHTIVTLPEVKANRIGIDTGAWRSDRLSCLVLEGDRRRLAMTV